MNFWYRRATVEGKNPQLDRDEEARLIEAFMASGRMTSCPTPEPDNIAEQTGGRMARRGSRLRKRGSAR